MAKKLLVVLMLMMIIPMSGVFAQDDVVCTGLADEDCAILIASSEAMQTVETVAFELGLDMNIAPDEESGEAPIAISLTGNGEAAIDLAMMEQLADMADLAPEDVMADIGAVLTPLLEGFDAKLSVTLSGDGIDDLPASSAEVFLIDGVLYIDLSSLFGSDEPFWMGLPLADLMSAATAELDMEEMEGAMPDMSAFMELSEMMSEEYITITRLPDTETDMGAAAAFLTEIDYAGMFSNPDFRDAFLSLVQQQIQQQLEATGDALPEGVDMDAMMDALVNALADSIVLTMTQWVDLDTNFIVRGEINFDMNLSRDALISVIETIDMEGDAETDNVFGIDMTMNASLAMSGFNEPVDIVAPEGAQVITPEMLLGSDA